MELKETNWERKTFPFTLLQEGKSFDTRQTFQNISIGNVWIENLQPNFEKLNEQNKFAELFLNFPSHWLEICLIKWRRHHDKLSSLGRRCHYALNIKRQVWSPREMSANWILTKFIQMKRKMCFDWQLCDDFEHRKEVFDVRCSLTQSTSSLIAKASSSLKAITLTKGKLKMLSLFCCSSIQALKEHRRWYESNNVCEWRKTA